MTILYLWVAMAIAKYVLCLATTPLAVKVLFRRNARTHGYLYWYSLTLVTTFIMCAFLWPVLLYMEGFRFFVVYRNRDVIHDIVIALRATNSYLRRR